MDEGNAAGAMREFRAVVAHNPIDPAQAHYELARALNPSPARQAEDELLAALETAPGYRPAQKLLLELNATENRNSQKGTDGKHHVNTRDAELEPEVLKTRIERFRQVQSEIVTQVRRVIVGQEEVLEQVMIGLFVGGHCLITGLPGTAKTLLVRTMAQTLGLVFKRIQFTPDLMPSDITGTDIIEEDPANGRRTWTFIRGPIFANILLADEINRTPPKTQSALLEAMQELACTVRGNGYKLARPSSCWPRKTPSSWKAPTRCPKRSSTASCST